MGKGIQPDMDYLHFKLKINDYKHLQKLIIEKYSSINMNEIAEDVTPFLFHPKDTKALKLFPEFIKNNWYN